MVAWLQGSQNSRLLGHRRAGLGGRTAAKGLVQGMAGGGEPGRVEKAAGGDSFSAGCCLSPVMSLLPAEGEQRPGVRSQTGSTHGSDTSWIGDLFVEALETSVFSSVKWGWTYMLCLPQEIVSRV